MNKRKQKADYIRKFRSDIWDEYIKLSSETRRRLRGVIKGSAASEFGNPKKPTLADYYPLKKHQACLSVTNYDGECGRNVYLFKGQLDEDDVLPLFPPRYGGPGAFFADNPHWEFNGFSTLVTQRVGRDI